MRDIVKKSEEALQQIEDRMYAKELEAECYTGIVKYGIAFCKKTAWLGWGNRGPGRPPCKNYPAANSFTRRSLNAFDNTEMELATIAMAAIMGFRSGPPKTCQTPMAMGMPVTL